MNRKQWGFSALGNCWCLWLRGEVCATLGPDWPFNLCILTIICAAFALFVGVMAPQVGFQMQFAGLVIMFTNLFCYLLTALANPGIVISTVIELQEPHKAGRPYCSACDLFLEKDVEHCDDCALCVTGLDHHCPLSGKCIAQGNLCYFYTFLVSLVAFFVYVAVWAFSVKALHMRKSQY